uniref:Uncharacterized protein n=1 Tax=Arion vulgaris TaxID=1028688 RepID=A0A0B6YS92_9EUPU
MYLKQVSRQQQKISVKIHSYLQQHRYSSNIVIATTYPTTTQQQMNHSLSRERKPTSILLEKKTNKEISTTIYIELNM